MIINKVTIGFVIQQFDTETRRFVRQDFIAEDDHTWETEDGDGFNLMNERHSELVYGQGGVDEPSLALEMKQPSEIAGIDKFKKGDKVLATPDLTGDTWSEFEGTVRGFRQGNLVTVEDQEGDCFDCHPDQLDLMKD
jgi:hypothetical protein